mgnify:CR=1 FL=1
MIIHLKTGNTDSHKMLYEISVFIYVDYLYNGYNITAIDINNFIDPNSKFSYSISIQ